MGKTTFTYGRRRRDLGLVGCLALLLFSAQPVASQSRPLVRQWDEALGYYNPAALAPLVQDKSQACGEEKTINTATTYSLQTYLWSSSVGAI